MPQSLTIWTNISVPEPELQHLRQSVGPHRIVRPEKVGESNLVAGGRDEGARTADIVLGQPSPLDLIESTNLKWVQISTAGYTAFDRDDLRAVLKSRGAVISNSSAVYAQPCAEHAMALILSSSRQLHSSVESQHTRTWPYLAIRARSSILRGQKFLIVGYGAIGHVLAGLLKPYNVEIKAFRRTPRGDESVETLPLQRVDEFLPSADHVINILPASPSTECFFNAHRFAAMKHTACFYNIGRGSTVDQYALRAELQTRTLAAAYLDVTTPEPLPEHDPLWSAPHCYITPHTAGGFIGEPRALVDHFIANLRRFEKGEPLSDNLFA